MDPYIGKMLDHRYEILERIGTGGMAIVYKAKCHRLNRLVALKILKSDLAENEDFRRRFNAESQAIAQLSHPNIVSVYDVSRGGDTDYIVMELIDGITLKQYMEKRGKLNWRESLHFITQIMRGLSHAHSRGIIHRDIKPQNVMVLRDGTVKVADFGIACLADSSQTMTQEALGSVHYISPEQAKGERPDGRSDIYSAGVVLYEMLTGRLPFEGESAVSVAIQHLASVPLPPREINPDIPEPLELICMRAMAPDLRKRYGSADSMIEDLEAFRKNPDVEMDFTLSDLHTEEAIDEPTRPIRTAAVRSAAHKQQERRRETKKGSDTGELRRGLLLAAVGLAALALVAVMFRSIMNSFQMPPEPDQYVVPSVLGLTIEEAHRHPDVEGIFEIQQADESIFSDEYAEKTIARQEPSANEYRKGNQLVIKVWLSAGEDRGEMLSVKNMTVSQAKVHLKQLIEKYALTIDSSAENQQFSEEVTADHIISTIPAEGEPVRKGDTIILIVSKGPDIKPLVVPTFVGQNIDTVRAQLTTFKLTCTDADIEIVDSTEPAGTIIWQSLDAVSEAMEWDTIKFKVSSGLKENQMPVSFELPQDGRDMVKVDIYVGSEATPQYSQSADCSGGYVTVMLTGSGTQEVRVYFDGILTQTIQQQFT